MNQVVLLSGESASGIEKLVRASAWGDEVIPTTVVIVDNDSAGHETRKKLTGEARGESMLLDAAMVCSVDSLFASQDTPVITTEDLIPAPLYEEALRRYVKKWNREVFDKTAARIKILPGTAGNLAAAQVVLEDIFATRAISVDKMGIAIEAIEIITGSLENAIKPAVSLLAQRVKDLCLHVKLRLTQGQKAERQRSGKQAVQRIISDFVKIRRFGAKIADLEELCLRLRREAKFSFGQEGEILEHIMDRWSTRLQDTRSAGQTEFRDAEWEVWRRTGVSVGFVVLPGSRSLGNFSAWCTENYAPPRS